MFISCEFVKAMWYATYKAQLATNLLIVPGPGFFLWGYLVISGHIL